LQTKRFSSDGKGAPSPLEVWRDAKKWRGYSKVVDPSLHVDLAKRSALLLLLAPICANALASLCLSHAHGLVARPCGTSA